MTMSMGMNTNVEYKGKVYHVQTEDGGLNHPTITTLLFKDGAVFASKRTDYKSLLDSPSCRETVAKMMKMQHKTILRELVAGKITSLVDANDALSDEGVESEKALNTRPEIKQEQKQKLNGNEEDLDKLILDYLAEKNK